MNKKRHVIIGSSAAGNGVLSRLRKLAPHDEIICLTAQKEMPYNTCLLADFLSDATIPKALWTKTHDFFIQHSIALHRETRVMSLDPDNTQVICSTGAKFSYDTLFIGTGLTPIQLSSEHPQPKNLFRFHTLSDTFAIDQHLRNAQPKTALVIGAGLSGVECADALVARGVSVTLLDGANHLLPRLIDTAASQVIHHLLKKHNTSFHPACHVTHVLTTRSGTACGVVLRDGTQLHADMVVSALGARPATGFAQDTGIELKDGGILIDHQLQTNLPNVYAGGDVATIPSLLDNSTVRSCTWPDAIAHGMHAARSMAGQEVHYPGASIVLSSVFFDIQFVTCGPVVTPPLHYDIIEHDGKTFHHRYLIHENKLKGFLLVGKLDHIGQLRRWVSTQSELSKAELISLTSPPST